MKFAKPLIATVALSLATTAAQAQTFNLLADIDVSANTATPSDMAYDAANDILYVTGFDNNAIVEILDVTTTTPVVSTIADVDDDLVNLAPYAAGRGLQSIEIDGSGDLLVAGDNGDHGGVFVYGTDGTIITEMADNSSFGGTNRRVSSATYLSGGRVLTPQTGSGIFTIAPTLDGLAGTAFTATSLSFGRHMIFVGDDVFLSTSASGNDRILKISGGTRADGNFGNYTTEEVFYDAGFSTFRSAVGIGGFSYGGTDYLAYPAIDGTNSSDIVFIDASGGAGSTAAGFNIDVEEAYAVISITAASDSDQFILVAQDDIGAAANARISVYGVDSAALDPGASVTNWEVLN